jgi:hypothetical protein
MVRPLLMGIMGKKWQSLGHNVTHLLGCVLCGTRFHMSIFPFDSMIPRVFGALKLYIVNFLTSKYKFIKKTIATSFFGK